MGLYKDMLGSEIEAVVLKYPTVASQFRGIFAADQIPCLKPFQFAVCNTGASDTPGKHWYTIHRPSSAAVIEVIDCLGLTHSEVVRRVKQKGHLEFNKAPLMPKNSTACGFFAAKIAVLRTLDRDLSLKEFLDETFSADLEENEIEARDFVQDGE